MMGYAAGGVTIKFLITHKPYEQLGPLLYDPMSPLGKIRRKLTPNPDRDWGSIRAFHKLRSAQVHWDFFESELSVVRCLPFMDET